MVSSWLINVIDLKLRTSVAYVETTEGMRQNLKRQYVVANARKVHQREADVRTCKQGGLLVVEFFSKLMGVWSKLDNAIFPQSNCQEYECKINDKLVKLIEEEKAPIFMGHSDDLY